jgi:hypothetical protein
MMDFENIQIQLVDSPALTLELGEAWFNNLARNADGLVLMVDPGCDPLDQMRMILKKLEEASVSPRGEGMPSGADERNAIIVCNKSDLPGAERQQGLLQGEFGQTFPVVSLSAKLGIGLDRLKGELFELLHIIRIYSKVPGKDVDRNEPFVLPEGSSLEEMAMRVHKDFLKKLKFARIWGSGKFSGQKVNKGFILSDGDVVELHL